MILVIASTQDVALSNLMLAGRYRIVTPRSVDRVRGLEADAIVFGSRPVLTQQFVETVMPCFKRMTRHEQRTIRKMLEHLVPKKVK